MSAAASVVQDTANAYFEVQDLKAYYGDSYIVQGISLSVNEGEIVALLGRNGAGKTSTLRAIARAASPELRSGSIYLQGQSIHDKQDFEAALAGIQLVPEDRRIIPGLTVEENLDIARISGEAGWEYERIYSLFPRLKERRKQEATTLSGGEQQMLAIGRALMTNPRLLILDEATEGLAPIVRQEIWAAIAALKAAGDMAILLVDKSLEELAAIADEAVILHRGKTVWSGDFTALDEATRNQFLGV